MGEIGIISGGLCETLLLTQLTDQEHKHRQEFLGMSIREKVKKVKNLNPKCECGAKMVMREGKFGKFWGCENYPKCKNTKQLK